MVLDKESNVGFAEKEITGVHYVVDVRGVQDGVVHDGDMAGLADRIRAAETARGADLKTAEATQARVQAIARSDRNLAAQAAADLIGKAGATFFTRSLYHLGATARRRWHRHGFIY